MPTGVIQSDQGRIQAERAAGSEAYAFSRVCRQSLLGVVAGLSLYWSIQMKKSWVFGKLPRAGSSSKEPTEDGNEKQKRPSLQTCRSRIRNFTLSRDPVDSFLGHVLGTGYGQF